MRGRRWLLDEGGKCTIMIDRTERYAGCWINGFIDENDVGTVHGSNKVDIIFGMI